MTHAYSKLKFVRNLAMELLTLVCVVVLSFLRSLQTDAELSGSN